MNNKKNENAKATTKKMTLAEMKTALSAIVEKYNESTDLAEKAELSSKWDALVVDYNDTSRIADYSTFKTASVPVAALVSKCTYPTIKVSITYHDEVDADGNSVKKSGYKVEDAEAQHYIEPFLDWASNGCINVTPAKNPKGAIIECKNTLRGIWEKAYSKNGETTTISNKPVKVALQKCVDAVMFESTENGNNKYMVNSKLALQVITSTNTMSVNRKSKKAELNVLSDATWKKMFIAFMKSLVDNSPVDIIYNYENGVESQTTEVKTDDKSKTKTSKKHMPTPAQSKSKSKPSAKIEAQAEAVADAPANK